MNKEIIQEAIKDGTLRRYDLTKAQVGDNVIALGGVAEVLAVYGEIIVFGWDLGTAKSVYSFNMHVPAAIYVPPLCWVEDKPVYKGDVLYSPSGTVKARVVNNVESYQEFDDNDKAVTRLRIYGEDGIWDFPESLTWVKPDPDSEYMVEGKVLKVGDTLFSKGGDKVTITALEMGSIITTPGQVMGGTQWTADYLSWTDPTILFEVEGKPVRRGDVLYGKWPGSLPRGYEIIGKNSAGYPLWRNGLLTYDLKDLTWIKPRSATLDINGHTIPDPEREPLTKGRVYFSPDICNGMVRKSTWGKNLAFDIHRLHKGLIHLSQEAASCHYNALISLTEK